MSRMPIYNVDPKSLLEEMISSPCGRCGQGGWFRLLAAAWAGHYYGGQFDQRPLISAMYQCAGCEKASIFTYQTYDVLGSTEVSLIDRFPIVGALINQELPEDIERDRHEAWVCCNNGLHRAAVLLGRAALQRAVRTLLEGSFRGDLHAEINKLYDLNRITQAQRDSAHEVRITGNDVAHPEELGTITQSEAKESLEFLDDFLHTTIVIPSKRESRVELRTREQSDS